MNKTDFSISLNFLAFETDALEFVVFRREVIGERESRQSEDEWLYSLPVTTGSEDYRSYWVTLEQKPGYAECLVNADTNRGLTIRAISHSLEQKATEEFAIHSRKEGFFQRIDLVMAEYEEGQDLFVLEPYYHKEQQKFGVIADFRFRKRYEIPFSRIVQQRSLSLTATFRRNVDFYADKAQRIRSYIGKCEHLLRNIELPGANGKLPVNLDFLTVHGHQLRPRIYSFAGGKESRSQFSGLKEFGPLRQLDEPPNLLFVFRQTDRRWAVKLANSLLGKMDQSTFKGFQELFGINVIIDPKPEVVQDFSKVEISAVLQRAKAQSGCCLPLFIVPDRNEDRYLTIKGTFAAEGMATQLCTVPLLQDDREFKWSISNIALQLFCKAGGFPWKVVPTTTDTLLIGISQSHSKHAETRAVERYFAFSILTDNSGLFQGIEVLAKESREEDYIRTLAQRLEEQLIHAAEKYKSVVVHASFLMRRTEMSAIEEAIRRVAAARGTEVSFAVLKVNQKTAFFGLNSNENSLIPYEASVTRLGGSEYLIWFEGIERVRPTVTKAFPGPTHIRKVWETQSNPISESDLLQDLVNLSGANWRGFNAKSEPVSVLYCSLVANLVHEFQLHHLPSPDVTGLRPWFL